MTRKQKTKMMEIPLFMGGYDREAAAALAAARHQINQAEAYMYYSHVAHAFDTLPGLTAMTLENEGHDSHYWAKLGIKQAETGADLDSIQKELNEIAEELNQFIGHTGIADYLAPLFSHPVISRDTLHEQLSNALGVVEGFDAWDQIKGSVLSFRLEEITPEAKKPNGMRRI